MNEETEPSYVNTGLKRQRTYDVNDHLATEPPAKIPKTSSDSLRHYIGETPRTEIGGVQPPIRLEEELRTIWKTGNGVSEAFPLITHIWTLCF